MLPGPKGWGLWHDPSGVADPVFVHDKFFLFFVLFFCFFLSAAVEQTLLKLFVGALEGGQVLTLLVVFVFKFFFSSYLFERERGKRERTFGCQFTLQVPGQVRAGSGQAK